MVKSRDYRKIKGFLQDKTLKVGIFETAKYPNGEYVASVGFWNEYGTINIPARPFFRNAIAKNKQKWIGAFQNFAKKAQDCESAMEMLGEIASGDIKDSITSLNTPPNAPSTIKKKKSSNPLIDTGLLRNSISYEVS